MQLNLNSQSSAQYVYKRNLQDNSFEAQNSSGRPPKIVQNIKKK